jgi:membrane-associated phospholipid phosphatase
VLSIFCALFLVDDSVIHADHRIAAWFHAHLAQPFLDLMLAFSDPGSPEWIATLTAVAAFFLIMKRHWYRLFSLTLTVPGGMLLNEILKEVVHRQRPFRESPFVDLSDYSFPSGHTMAATLLYGMLAVIAVLMIRGRIWRSIIVLTAVLIVMLVGLSRIALGAHYLTDVLAAIAAGGGWLWLCWTAVEKLRRRRLQTVVAQSDEV